MCCFYSRKNFFRSYMRARKNKRSPGSTYNMPEKHQIFARPNKTLKIIGTARAINRQHEPLLPSIPSRCTAALITNTSCELIVPIQCTLHTRRTMVSAHHIQKQFVFFPTPRNRALQYATTHAMQCICNASRNFLAYQGKVVQPKPARALAYWHPTSPFERLSPPTLHQHHHTLTEQADRHKNCSSGCTCQFSSRGFVRRTVVAAARPPMPHVGFSAASHLELSFSLGHYSASCIRA